MSKQFIIRAYHMDLNTYMYYVAGLKLYAWSSSPADAQAYTMYESAVNRMNTLKRRLWQCGEYNVKYKDLEIIPIKIEEEK